MKSFEHDYNWTGWPSKCRVHIKDMGLVTWICFENESGTSVTNASELLATEIVEKEGLDPNQCRFFEYYPEYEGNVDEVEYEWRDNKAHRATWKHFCKKETNPFLSE